MTQHRFRKDILLAVNGKQIHRRLKHLPTKPATLALFLTSRPGLTFWQILGIGTACRSKGCHVLCIVYCTACCTICCLHCCIHGTVPCGHCKSISVSSRSVSTCGLLLCGRRQNRGLSSAPITLFFFNLSLNLLPLLFSSTMSFFLSVQFLFQV